MQTGASGYVLKDDQTTMRDLASVIHFVADGRGIHLSQYAYDQITKGQSDNKDQPLINQQLEVLSLCAAYPDASTTKLASILNITNSTLRNLLSEAYIKLNVRTRTAAIAKARQMELIPPDVPADDLRKFGGSED